VAELTAQGVRVSEPVGDTLNLLGDATVSLGLICVGAALDFSSMRSAKWPLAAAALLRSAARVVADREVLEFDRKEKRIEGQRLHGYRALDRAGQPGLDLLLQEFVEVVAVQEDRQGQEQKDKGDHYGPDCPGREG
jgi:hypothetical protein